MEESFPETNSKMTFNVVVGSAIAVTTSMLASLGVNLQASSLQQERVLNTLAERDAELTDSIYDLYEDVEEEDPILPPSRFSPRTLIKLQWYLGFAIYIFTQIFGSVIALTFISPMILAPLGAIGLVFNILFAKAFLGTEISKYDWIGTIEIMIGCGIVSGFGSQIPEPQNQQIEDLIRRFSKPAFVIYAIILSSLLVFLVISTKSLELRMHSLKSFSRRNSIRDSEGEAVRLSSNHAISLERIDTAPPSAQSEIATINTIENSNHSTIYHSITRRKPIVIETSSDVILSPGLVQSPTVDEQSENTPLLAAATRSVRRGRLSSIIGVMYAVLGGTVASCTLLLTKSGVDVVVAAVLSGRMDHGLFSGILIAFLVVTGIAQVYFLNQGLKYEVSVVVLPIFYTAFTCFSLLNTMIYLAEGGSVYQILGICIGLSILILGVFTMAGSKGSE